MVVRTLYTIQLRRLQRTWTDIDRYTAVAEGGAAANRPDLHLDRLESSTVAVHLIAAAHGADDTRPAFLSDTAIATGSRIVPRLTWERVAANHATLLFDPATARAVDDVLTRRVDPRD